MQSFRWYTLVLCGALTLALASASPSFAQCSRGGGGGPPSRGNRLVGMPRPGMPGRPNLLRTASPLQRQLLLITLQQRMLQGQPTQGQQPGLFLQQKNQVMLRLLDRLEDEDDAVIAQALRSTNPYVRKAAAIESRRRKGAEKKRVELEAR